MILQSHKLVVARGMSGQLALPDVVLQAGEAVLLLGASGSGKTSLLAALAGFLPPISGQVTSAGQDIYALSEAQRDSWRARNMACIFQNFHLLSAFTVADNIKLAAKLAGKTVSDKDLSDWLAQFALPQELAGFLPHRLSQGEQQRVSMIRALVCAPTIILADEPTSALDDANTATVMQALGQCHRNNTTLLVASHDQRLMPLFDRVIAMSSILKDVA